MPSKLALQVKKYMRVELPMVAPDAQLAVAVSGGLDSVVLLHLLLELGYKLGVVHVNHQLRGDESDGDEAFVAALAARLGLAFHTRRVDVKSHAKANDQSTQEAARELRYGYFEELQAEHYRWIATAHHQDDDAESILYSLIRGGDWQVLKGISDSHNDVIRPLLCTTRAEMEAYQKRHKLAYREDSSNAEDHYLRNKLRHQVMPVLREINPNLSAQLAERLELYEYQMGVIHQHLVNRYNSLNNRGAEADYILLEDLAQIPEEQALLHFVTRLPKPWGGNFSNCAKLVGLLKKQVGKRIQIPGFEAWRERDRIAYRITPDLLAFYQTSIVPLNTPIPIEEGRQFSAFVRARSEFLPGPGIEMLAYEAITPPLTLRTWQAGDRYQPLGLQGTKLVSDILTDTKVPSHIRSQCLVLCDQAGIVLLLGHRPAERCRVLEGTEQVLEVRTGRTSK